MTSVTPLEQRVLQIIDGLLAEIRADESSRTTTLDDSLSDDLGLGSLERVELVLRVEQAFGISLPERAVETQTPAELASLLKGADMTPISQRAAPRAQPSGATTSTRISITSVPSLAGRGLHTAWAVLFAALTLPILWILLRLRPSGNAAHRLFGTWSRLTLTAAGYRVHVTGIEHLEDAAPAVLIANHASYIDPIVLIAAIPTPLRFVVKWRLRDYPMIGTVVRRARYLPIDRTNASTLVSGAAELPRALAAGDSLLMFPEGTFLRFPRLLPFRLGAFHAAAEVGRPIVPVALRGTRHILPDGAWLLRRGPIEIIIAEPLWPEGSGWQCALRLRERARGAIVRTCGES